MKKTLLASAALAVMTAAGSAHAEIKLGVLMAFTGPLESLSPAMADSAELAFKEASDSGLLLGGETITPVRADSACIDNAVGVASAERLVTSEGVAAIVGAMCSGVTTAVANNVGVPNGVVMISPSATSPGLTTIEDNGYFFRTAPSDARQGQVLAEIVRERGVDSVAITYTNNDYGKGLEESFGSAFEALGGTVVMTAPHEDGKGDYSAEVGALAASGADELVVFGYVDQGGKGIVEAATDADAFERFIFADGMIGDAVVSADVSGSFGTRPGSDSDSVKTFHAFAEANGVEGDGSFRPESYDAAALIVLAIQAAGSADRTAIRDNILNVANAPGEPIGPGEIAKGLEILAGGGDVDFVGATGVEFNDIGETFGSYQELEILGDDFELKSVR